MLPPASRAGTDYKYSVATFPCNALYQQNVSYEELQSVSFASRLTDTQSLPHSFNSQILESHTPRQQLRLPLYVLAMDPNAPPSAPAPQPSIFRWILGFLMVGACWGLTTPFMRRAAMNYTPPARPSLTDPNNSWLKKKVLGIWYAVIGVLSRPAYAVPLLLNVTGSVWFFILIGKAGECYFGWLVVQDMFADDVVELSLTVPITNSLAFLFTVLGEWWAEKKVINRGKSSSS